MRQTVILALWACCLPMVHTHTFLALGLFSGGFLLARLVIDGDDRRGVLVRAGVDGIQFDKVPPCELHTLVPELRAIDPHVTLIAAGGINPTNAADYAATGVDGLVTTALFTAKPLDMSVRMSHIE